MKRRIRERKVTILQLFWATLLTTLMLPGCVDDVFEPVKGGFVDQTGVPEGFVRARINLVASGFEVVQTKSLDDQQEHAWTHVVAGQFNSNNELVASSVQKYSYGTNGNFDLILQESNDEENLIYFITNYGDAGGNMTDAKHNPFIDPSTNNLVTNLDEFKALVYTPDSTDNAGISAGDKLVMAGSIQTVVDRASTPISSMLVYVDKLTAKLDVQIRAAQAIAHPDHPFNGATLTVTGLKIMNVPKQAAFTTDGRQVTDPEDLASIDAVLENDGGDLVKRYKTAGSYYILENRMHDDSQPLYPDNASERGQEQFKNQAARDNNIDDLATYLLIDGNLNDGRNVGKVSWTIYLGENNVDNFNIKRNTHYTITVQINGAGIATSDIRVNKENLHMRELRYLNSRYGSNRTPETSYPGPNDKNWGNLISPAPVANNNYLYMDAGNETWGFRLVGSGGTNLADWPGLSVSYLPLAEAGATDPGTTTGMNAAQIRAKWLPDDVESNWITLPGLSATGLPSGVRVRINIGANNIPSQRIVEFHYFNDAEPDLTRVWRLTQSAGEMLNIVDRNFFPSAEGKYGVMVRAKEDTYWKVQSGSDTNFKFAGAADSQGNLAQTDLNTGYVKGHGTILYNTTEYSSVPYRSMTVVVRTFEGNPEDVPAPGYVDKTVYIYQMGSAANFDATKNNTSGRYVYDYSSDPLFETMLAFPVGVPIGINLLDEGTDYKMDESKFEAWSTSDGKENTLKIFRKLEGYVADQTIPSGLGLKAPPVFSPAGLCMMMNENWWEITSKDDPRFEWYLPARYHGLMDATAVMLGVAGIGHTSQGAFWTSTVPLTPPTEERTSVYFAGTTVDVSANYSALNTVRCVRDKKNVTKSYPYLTQDYAGNPVIVSYEKVGSEAKGFVKVQTSTSASHKIYKLGKPLRFTEPGQVSDEGGTGPSDPSWSYLSPKFRVAKADAVVKGTSLIGPWTVASGWSDENAADVATPATGCASYVEDGTGWRLPSELEMRLILLLGGGVGSKPGSTAQVPVVQTGGMSFSDFTSSGFNYLGVTSGRSYWVNRKYPNDNRSVYFTVSDRWTNAISGSAVGWTSEYYVRCVRDQ